MITLKSENFTYEHNSSENELFDDFEQQFIYTEWRKNNSEIEIWHHMLGISGCVVSVIGIIGNLISLVALLQASKLKLTKRFRHKTTNTTCFNNIDHQQYKTHYTYLTGLAFCDLFSCIFAILNILEYIPSIYIETYSIKYRSFCLFISLYTLPFATTLQALSVWLICAFSIHRCKFIATPFYNTFNNKNLKFDNSFKKFKSLKLNNYIKLDRNMNKYCLINVQTIFSKREFEFNFHLHTFHCFSCINLPIICLTRHKCSNKNLIVETIEGVSINCDDPIEEVHDPNVSIIDPIMHSITPTPPNTNSFLSLSAAVNNTTNENSLQQQRPSIINNFPPTIIIETINEENQTNSICDNKKKLTLCTIIPFINNYIKKRTNKIVRTRVIIGLLYALALVYLLPQLFEKTIIKIEINNKYYVFPALTTFGASRIFRHVYHLWLYKLAVCVIPFILIFTSNFILLRIFYKSKKRCKRYKFQPKRSTCINETQFNNIHQTSEQKTLKFQQQKPFLTAKQQFNPLLNNGLCRRHKLLEKSTRLTLALFGVVLLFLICHLPSLISRIMYILYPEMEFQPKSKLTNICFYIANFLIMLNSSINFIPYILFGPRKFRQEFSNICLGLVYCLRRLVLRILRR